MKPLFLGKSLTRVIFDRPTSSGLYYFSALKLTNIFLRITVDFACNDREYNEQPYMSDKNLSPDVSRYF